ncbi:iron donor protein CyaY [Deltaproteobacteria bacterium TL4]
METKDYLKRSKELFKRIEEKLDEFEDEIDFDYASGKLDISFESGGNHIIVNTQQALHEIWLAGNGKGWHFKYLEDQEIWYAQAEQEEFFQAFAKLLGARLKRRVTFNQS